MSSSTNASDSEVGISCLCEMDKPQFNSEAQNINDVNGTDNETTSTKSKSSSNKSSDQEESEDSPENGFENISFEDVIADCTFAKLIERMRDFHFDINVNSETLINTKCKLLFERDYRVEIVKNSNLTNNYPMEIIVPVAEKGDGKEINPMNFNAEFYKELVTESRVARLRSRFVAPVILFDNKFICRSGTLTVWLSAMYERARQSMPTTESITEAALSPIRTLSNAVWKMAEIAYESINLITSSNVMEPLFVKDAEILEHLKVERICDLMVEYNKHYKQQVNVSSTEKLHEAIYADIKMEEMPYPGCEFFYEYYKEGRIPFQLKFDWRQSDVTRTLHLTEIPKPFTEWYIKNYKAWNLVELTKNYLRIMLSNLVTGEGGMVVHCISGWDRTSLFVCLLRLSLWADCVIHQSLNEEEIAYLTVAYDWFLFGHNLPDRLKKNEEVMHFCFTFLDSIVSDDFSVTWMFQELSPEKKRNRTFIKYIPGRRRRLRNIRRYVLEFYDSLVISRADYE